MWAAGIDTYSSKGSGIIDDFLGADHLKDIFHCATTYDHDVHLYQNVGNGTFVDVTAAAGEQHGLPVYIHSHTHTYASRMSRRSSHPFMDGVYLYT
jgi:hypothetical protein